MQLAHLHVDGLFGTLRHDVPFPTRPDDDTDSSPSVAILHGANGIGKTTLLRMLSGLLALDFTAFRQVPFRSCYLEFSTGDRVSVSVQEVSGQRCLEVSFGDSVVRLKADEAGPLHAKDEATVELFRARFFEATDDLNMEFVETSRVHAGLKSGAESWEEIVEILPDGGSINRRQLVSGQRRNRRDLARKVTTFVREAQLDHRRFFTRTETDLFPRILERLNSGDAAPFDADVLARRLLTLKQRTDVSERLGLEVEQWDFNDLMGYIDGYRTGDRAEQTLTVLGAYTEFLESRVAQRDLLAHRLLKFEEIVNGFFTNKRLDVNRRGGFKITADGGHLLYEEQLSSGEQHLLYLMVSALTAHRRGTVIAIDEPELSMHPAWQRKLVSKLIDCASNASPQLVMATHSPEIIADYQDALVHIS